MKEETNECILPRLSFEKRLAAHRSNRLNNTFGQINIPYDTTQELEIDDDNILVPTRCKTSHQHGK